MRSKFRIVTCVWLAALALCLASLFALSRLAGEAGYANRLLVTPNTFGTQGLSVERLEEFAEEEFPLTYRIRQSAEAQAIHSRHSVTLVGTTHSYPGILGYATLDGGFFTKASMDAKSRHTALNETAAFQIFGSNRIAGSALKLMGETWIVTGVIQDYDTENANLYVPASVSGGQADSILVLMDETITEPYVKNALKQVGVHDARYDFINLSKSARAFDQRFSAAWKLALSAGILLLILASGRKLTERFRFYRRGMREFYFREWIAHYRMDFLKTLGGLLAIAGGCAAILALSLQILEAGLVLRDLPAITGELAAGDFGQKLLWLRDYQTWDRVLFWVWVCLILLGLAVALSRRARRPKDGHMRADSV